MECTELAVLALLPLCSVSGSSPGDSPSQHGSHHKRTPHQVTLDDHQLVKSFTFLSSVYPSSDYN